MSTTIYDRAEVTRIATQAEADGIPMSHAVAARWGLTPQRASKLICKVRGAGYDIPPSSTPRNYAHRETRRETLPHKASMGLVCECGETFPVYMIDLARHTLKAHHRAPSRTELTPVKRAA